MLGMAKNKAVASLEAHCGSTALGLEDFPTCTFFFVRKINLFHCNFGFILLNTILTDTLKCILGMEVNNVRMISKKTIYIYK